MGSFYRRARVLGAAAAVGVAAILGMPGRVQASTGVTMDLRVHDTGSKVAFVSGPGVLTLDLYATLTGADSDSTNDLLVMGAGSLQSVGGVLRDLLGLPSPAPFNRPPSQIGGQVDLDGDGDLDIGTGNSAYAFRSNIFNPPQQPAGGYLVGNFSFTVTSAPDGAMTQFLWTPALPIAQTFLIDGAQAPTCSRTVRMGAPLYVMGMADPPGGVQTISGTIADHLSVTQAVKAQGTLTLSTGLDVAAGGRFDATSSSAHQVIVTDTTSGNAGGRLYAPNLEVRGNGLFTQSAGTTFINSLRVGTEALSNATFRQTGGSLVGGTMTVGGAGGGQVQHTGGSMELTQLTVGSSTAASFEVSNSAALSVSNDAWVGSGSASGAYSQTGGTAQFGNLAIGGGAAAAAGTLHLTGGTLTVNQLNAGVGQGSQYASNPGAGNVTVDGGTLQAMRMVLGPNGHASQSAGSVVADVLTTANTYQYSGGTLQVNKRWSGDIDFNGKALSMTLGAGSLNDLTVENAQNATLILGEGALLNATAAELAELGHFDNHGIVHHPGDALAISAAQAIHGTGSIQGNVTNSGLLDPGFSPGEIDVVGTLTQQSSATLRVQIGGTTITDDSGHTAYLYDIVKASGAATLGGTLDVSLIDGFTPLATDSFTILSAPSVTGQFANAPSTVSFADGTFNVSYSPTAVTLSGFTASAVPEPGTLGLVVIGAVLTTRTGRRRA